MDTLLKDKPEFKERIENNVHLRQDVENIINRIDCEYDGQTVNIPTHEVNWATDKIINLFTTFINQNYK